MSVTDKHGVYAILCSVVGAVGSVFHIIGLSTPTWSALAYLGQRGSKGLWEYCVEEECKYYAVKDDSLKVCEAFSILGMLASFLAVTVSVCQVYWAVLDRQQKKRYHYIASSSCFLAFLFILISIIVWRVKMHGPLTEEHYEIGYSFIVSIVGSILIVITGFIQLVSY